jgi:hypothetical protein
MSIMRETIERFLDPNARDRRIERHRAWQRRSVLPVGARHWFPTCECEACNAAKAEYTRVEASRAAQQREGDTLRSEILNDPDPRVRCDAGASACRARCLAHWLAQRRDALAKEANVLPTIETDRGRYDARPAKIRAYGRWYERQRLLEVARLACVDDLPFTYSHEIAAKIEALKAPIFEVEARQDDYGDEIEPTPHNLFVLSGFRRDTTALPGAGVEDFGKVASIPPSDTDARRERLARRDRGQ